MQTSESEQGNDSSSTSSTEVNGVTGEGFGQRLRHSSHLDSSQRSGNETEVSSDELALRQAVCC